jgi:photosystem II stability/assembly factor-like uncharacterized protein
MKSVSVSFRVICSVLLSIAFTSCSKNDDPDPDPAPTPTPTAVDTISSGWTKVPIPENGRSGDIFFVGQTGFVTGQNFISKSTDYGNTWHHVASVGGYGYNLAMGSPNNCIVLTYNNKLFVTNDGGSHFDSLTLNDSHITDVFFASTTTAYAVGAKFWKSSDGGFTWTKIYDFDDFGLYKTLFFIDPSLGWSTRPDLVKTVNGGSSWSPQSGLHSNSQVLCLHFVSATRGFIAAEEMLETTADGGQSWNPIFHFSTGGYHDIHFVNAQLGYVTDDNRVWKTTDGGVTWTLELSIAQEVPSELHFTDANHGWLAGPNGYILKYEK